MDFPNSDQFKFVTTQTETPEGIAFSFHREQRRSEPLIDIERAKKQKSLRGDPFLAPPGCSYSAGSVIDYFCLACGSTFAAHDENSNCWRVLKTEEELAQYDRCKSICDQIEFA